MKLRIFSRVGWSVSENPYGMWGMGGWIGSDDAESLDSLQRSIDLHEQLHAHRWDRTLTEWSH